MGSSEAEKIQKATRREGPKLLSKRIFQAEMNDGKGGKIASSPFTGKFLRSAFVQTSSAALKSYTPLTRFAVDTP